MYSPGHVGLALLCFAPIAAVLRIYGLRRTAQVGVVGFLLTASAPDIDLYIATIPHRGITHTITVAVAVGVFFGVIGALTRVPALRSRRDDFLFGFCTGTLGIGTHLVGDVITPMGIRPFAPFFDAHYTLDLVYASDPSANAGFLIAGVTAYQLSTHLGRTFARPPMPIEPVTTLVDVDADLSLNR